jgi:sorbitol-specific phosphotransferase system component IIC
VPKLLINYVGKDRMTALDLNQSRSSIIYYVCGQLEGGVSTSNPYTYCFAEMFIFTSDDLSIMRPLVTGVTPGSIV